MNSAARTNGPLDGVVEARAPRMSPNDQASRRLTSSRQAQRSVSAGDPQLVKVEVPELPELEDHRGAPNGLWLDAPLSHTLDGQGLAAPVQQETVVWTESGLVPQIPRQADGGVEPVRTLGVGYRLHHNGRGAGVTDLSLGLRPTQARPRALFCLGRLPRFWS